MNSAEKIPADVAFLNAPIERLEGVLRNVIAALTARGKNISDILRYTTPANNASLSNSRKQSDDENSEEEDFKHCQDDEEIRKNVKDLDLKPVQELDGRGHRRGPPPDGRGIQAS
ncbi:hypothetical protein HHI36_024374 [Cryptolaemus montrouzieri]|uniref:Uncharacterized protein n=1 Tax=Cryptolaemus montrouzieri TaxID=559131 RepID=A0ABD2NQR8_9CUCU